MTYNACVHIIFLLKINSVFSYPNYEDTQAFRLLSKIGLRQTAESPKF